MEPGQDPDSPVFTPIKKRLLAELAPMGSADNIHLRLASNDGAVEAKSHNVNVNSISGVEHGSLVAPIAEAPADFLDPTTAAPAAAAPAAVAVVAVPPPLPVSVASSLMMQHAQQPPPSLAHRRSISLPPIENDAVVITDVSNGHWQKTLEKCVHAIVSIRLSMVRSFDTEQAGSAVATGFIVDSARGIILTNRHVVNPGPIVAEAILYAHEEVPIRAIYRDPVHDFGFFQFDTAEVKYMKLTEISLRPDKYSAQRAQKAKGEVERIISHFPRGTKDVSSSFSMFKLKINKCDQASVGVDIRVVGNDAGTLARLDRRAPDYGMGRYNDFNTFYYQAASSTSGGSSGSPVLNIDGQAVALNAGGKNKAATSYYLPLDRVERALRLIQRGEPVTRGTLQTIFKHSTYDEVRRLGLRSSIEQRVRSELPDETGMLVVDQVLPKGPAAGALQSGDILVSINGQLVTRFVALETILDSSVGQSISVTVERGDKDHTFALTVQDLHSITPNRYVEFGGAVLNELSYMLAKSYCIPTGGVFVAQAGYWLGLAQIVRNSLIIAVGNQRVSSLSEFVEVVKNLPDSLRVPIRWCSLRDMHRERVNIAIIERHWHSALIASRNDSTGLWDHQYLPPPPPRSIPAPPQHGARYVSLKTGSTSGGNLDDVVSSFVTVEFTTPFCTDGVKTRQYVGAGLVLDAASGLLVCDRNSVPIHLGDLQLTFANTIIVPAKIEYLHPLYNLAFARYDPKLIGDTPVTSAKLAQVALQQGDSVNLIVLTKSQQPVLRKTVVVNVRPFFIRECSPPRFRAMNVDGIEVDNPTAACSGGVLCDDSGLIQGLWISYSCQDGEGQDTEFFMGFHAHLLIPLVESLKRGETPPIRGLEVELHQVQLAQSRSLGLSDEWVRRIESSSESRRMLLAVRRLTAGTQAASLLREGDLLLAVQDTIITGFSDLDMQTLLHAVQVDVLRDGKESRLEVPTSVFDGKGTDRVIGWSGATFQEPHKAVAQQISSLPCRVYCSWWVHGSPAQMYGLRTAVFVVEVDGHVVNTMDDFLEAVSKCVDNSYVRVKTIDFGRFTKVLTIKVNLHYFPTWELRSQPSDPSDWRLTVFPNSSKQPHSPTAKANFDGGDALACSLSPSPSSSSSSSSSSSTSSSSSFAREIDNSRAQRD